MPDPVWHSLKLSRSWLSLDACSSCLGWSHQTKHFTSHPVIPPSISNSTLSTVYLLCLQCFIFPFAWTRQLVSLALREKLQPKKSPWGIWFSPATDQILAHGVGGGGVEGTRGCAVTRRVHSHRGRQRSRQQSYGHGERWQWTEQADARTIHIGILRDG